MHLTRLFRSLFTQSRASDDLRTDTPSVPCPVCATPSSRLDGLDFNKSCEEARGKFLPRSGVIMDYHLCPQCRFCFAPRFLEWNHRDFQQNIYNAEYVHVDPDYVDARPRSNAAALIRLFGDAAEKITHLDYGGGAGLLSELLRRANWQSSSFDPFPENMRRVDSLETFDLITAFEVFEHVPHVQSLMADLSSLLSQPGLVLFTTLLSEGHIKPGASLDWWYAAPRNGHVSLFSRQSLALLGSDYGFRFGSLSENCHAYWKELPGWASSLFQARS